MLSLDRSVVADFKGDSIEKTPFLLKAAGIAKGGNCGIALLSEVRTVECPNWAFESSILKPGAQLKTSPVITICEQ